MSSNSRCSGPRMLQVADQLAGSSSSRLSPAGDAILDGVEDDVGCQRRKRCCQSLTSSKCTQ